MMKGYKITDSKRSKLVGVASSSLTQLSTKARQKLNVGVTEEVALALEDGTLLDDEHYFRSLPAQTVVVVYRKDEPIVTGVDILLNALRAVNSTYLKTGASVGEFVQQKISELAEILEHTSPGEDKLRSTAAEDPAWFEGLDTNDRTKEEVMARKSRDRLRGYLYKFQEDMRKATMDADTEARALLKECLSFFKEHLARDHYFGCYFDRRAVRQKQDEVDSMHSGKKHPGNNWESGLVKRPKITEEYEETDGKRRCKVVAAKWPAEELGALEVPTYTNQSYCDATGKFVCQGRWEVPNCAHSEVHQINPYLSREARILFSTWNLDHRIEKSRTVVPTLLAAIRNRKECQQLNWMYFYQLLFTNYNLKMVHVVCHDKTVHSIACDPRLVYRT